MEFIKRFIITNRFIRSLTAFFLARRLRTKIILGGLLLLVIFFISRVLFFSHQQSQYVTQPVTKGDLIDTITEDGTVSAPGQVAISSPATGIIEQVYVKNGDEVSAGDSLFEVRSTASNQEKTQAYASYLQAQSNLAQAQADLNSLQAAEFKANQAFLNDKGAVTNPSDAQKADPNYIQENATWLQAEANYKNQTLVIAQAEAAYNAAALAYQQTQDATVTSPIDGTVANLAYSTGAQVSGSGGSSSTIGSSNNLSGTSGGSSTTGATSLSGSSNSSVSSGNTVMLVGDFSTLQIVAQVNEVDIAKIKTGQKATITFDALNGKSYVGSVESVDTVGTVSSGVVTYNVTIGFDYPPSDVRSGMSATITIETARKDNVLMVPSSAVQTLNGQSYVRVLSSNNKIQEVPVTLGMTTDTQDEITSGLNVGQSVVTSVVSPRSTTTTGASPFSAGLGGNRTFGGGFGGGSGRTGGQGAGGTRGGGG